jgi:hypothetical protein
MANKLPIEVSFQGVAAFTHLYEPDAKFAKPGEAGKYKMALIVQKEGVDKLEARVNGGSDPMGGPEWVIKTQQMHKDAGGGPPNTPIKDGDKPVDKHGQPKPIVEEFAGTYRINFSSQYQPQLVDTKKNDLPPDVKIMSGDIVKVAFRPNMFDGGCNLYLNAVMLIEKNAGGGGGGASAFGEEDGFVAEKSAAADAFGAGEAETNGDY